MQELLQGAAELKSNDIQLIIILQAVDIYGTIASNQDQRDISNNYDTSTTKTVVKIPSVLVQY